MQDSLGPLVHQMLFGDLPALAWPFTPVRPDRGQALERAWGANLHGALERPLTALRDGEREGWRPSLIFAPMLVESGRRLLVSNLDLLGLFATRCADLARDGDPTLQSWTACEFYRLFGDAPLTVATAARMSASFPYFSPAVALPTEPRRRVVDAGYYDNYGVGLAVEWLFQNRAWLAEHANGVVLVQVRDSFNVADRVLTATGTFDGHTGPMQRNLQELTSPIEGVLAAREAVSSFRNDESLAKLGHAFEADPRFGQEFFATVTLELPGDVSLNWHLTRREQVRINEASRALRQSPDPSLCDDPRYAGLCALYERAQKLLAWWQRRLA
jgi:hypothetical protein